MKFVLCARWLAFFDHEQVIWTQVVQCGQQFRPVLDQKPSARRLLENMRADWIQCVMLARELAGERFA